jgi:esterase/lipase superfamily enzyme
MFTISSRADFASPDAFSSTDEARPWHSAEASLSPLALANRLRGGRVLVPVHGFNYRFQDATVLFRTVAQTAERHFPDAYDAVVGYTWPSATAAYSYFTAKGRVPEAGLRLRRWLDALWAAGCTIDLAGHSMGVRVAAAATREPGALRVRNLFLLAAAAGTDVLDPLSDAGDSVYVFHTRKDEALGRWYQRPRASSLRV